MKFKRSNYPDYPGMKGYPCLQLDMRYLHADLDWNTDHPPGVSWSVNIGPQPRLVIEHTEDCKCTDDRWDYENCKALEKHTWMHWLLDVNAPLGEPHRLYLGIWKLFITLSLWPGHGIGRYNYRHICGCGGGHEFGQCDSETGEWVRKEKPERWHWGWLTVETR